MNRDRRDAENGRAPLRTQRTHRGRQGGYDDDSQKDRPDSANWNISNEFPYNRNPGGFRRTLGRGGGDDDGSNHGSTIFINNSSTNLFMDRKTKATSGSVLLWHSGGDGNMDEGTTRLTQNGLQKLGIPEDAWLEVNQGHEECWRKICASADKRYQYYDVGEIPIRDLHIDETKMTRYTQWTRPESLTKTEDIFVWYRQVRVEAAMFCIPLTPFDGIVLDYSADGLCVPGIGAHIYAKCGAAFLHILQKMLLLHMSRELIALSTTAKNGYEFLWHVLQRTVDMLDERTTILRPPKEDDVFRAAEAWDLYRIIQIHHGQNMTQYECRRQYLLSFIAHGFTRRRRHWKSPFRTYAPRMREDKKSLCSQPIEELEVWQKGSRKRQSCVLI